MNLLHNILLCMYRTEETLPQDSEGFASEVEENHEEMCHGHIPA